MYTFFESIRLIGGACVFCADDCAGPAGDVETFGLGDTVYKEK